MMIALVTVAVFIYRKPFQHLFSSVGYGMLGADERAEVSVARVGLRVPPGDRDARRAPSCPARPRPARPGGRARTAADGGGSRRRDRRPAPPRAASAPPPPMGCRAGRRPTATPPRGTGRPPGSAPDERRRRCRCRPTAPRRPLTAVRRAGPEAAAGPAPARAARRSRRSAPPARCPPRPRRQPGRRRPPPQARPGTRPTATRTASTPPAPTQSTPAPAPPFWSRSRRRPQ